MKQFANLLFWLVYYSLQMLDTTQLDFFQPFFKLIIYFSESIRAFFSESIRVGSMVEWLKHQTDDQHGLSSKPTCTILLCPWEKTLYSTFPCLVVLTSNSKLQ